MCPLVAIQLVQLLVALALDHQKFGLGGSVFALGRMKTLVAS